MPVVSSVDPPALPLCHPVVPHSVLHGVQQQGHVSGCHGCQNISLVPHILPPLLPQLPPSPFAHCTPC